MKGIVRVRKILHVAILPGIFTGEMEEAGGAMVSEDAPLVDFETPEGAGQTLPSLRATRERPDARRQGLDARCILRCAGRGGWL